MDLFHSCAKNTSKGKKNLPNGIDTRKQMSETRMIDGSLSSLARCADGDACGCAKVMSGRLLRRLHAALVGVPAAAEVRQRPECHGRDDPDGPRHGPDGNRALAGAEQNLWELPAGDEALGGRCGTARCTFAEPGAGEPALANPFPARRAPAKHPGARP